MWYPGKRLGDELRILGLVYFALSFKERSKFLPAFPKAAIRIKCANIDERKNIKYLQKYGIHCEILKY